MFLRSKIRNKDGKAHRYWSVVENRRCSNGKVVQRSVLSLGELNDAQQAGWLRSIEAVCEDGSGVCQLALFPQDREVLSPGPQCHGVQVRLDRLELRRPRQWGACWLAMHLWSVLELDRFWEPLLKPSRKGTPWLSVLKALVAYRLIDPGSEFRFHRQWFSDSAMGDLLGGDFRLAQKDKPYRCLDQLLEHKEALFDFLRDRWTALFAASYDLILYDLTSTYFESDPPKDPSSKKAFGYSRDHRPDCVQVVIALVVTPEGFPLAYEVYRGNTSEAGTLEDFLERIAKRFGKARRTWLMDRGIPTEQTLEKMRAQSVQYLVGTPKARLSKLESALCEKPWVQARDSVRVKMLEQDREFYVYVQSESRVGKERSMRRRRLKRLWNTLSELGKRKKLSRDALLMALGAAKKEAGRAWNLISIQTPLPDQPVNDKTFRFQLDRQALRTVRRREGRYLLRSNMTTESPELVWENYLLLVRIEQAFKDLKGDLAIRPIWHHADKRIEAHIFVCFLSYCLHTTLRGLARQAAGGLTTAAIVDKLKTIQMIDVHLPTTDDRHLVLSRYTQPEPDVALLLARLNLNLPEQPPPKIYSTSKTTL